MTDNEIARTLAEQSEEFRRLGEEHRNLDQQLIELQGRVYLTPDEEIEKKRMQKLKLLKKDQMAEHIRHYKETHSIN